MGILSILLLRHPLRSVPLLIVFAIAMIVADLLLTVRLSPGSHFTISSTFLLVYFVLGGGVAAAALDGLARSVTWL
ncbi:MAG TPA: hypothetical protein VIL97_03525, partial [Thermoanaerobaculia bacterium]